MVCFEEPSLGEALAWLEGVASGEADFCLPESRYARRVLVELRGLGGQLVVVKRHQNTCVVLAVVGVVLSGVGFFGSLALRFGWL
jgi:hypothetical protein